MSKADRETAIIIAAVLIVCLISLVAILVSIWQLIGPGINTIANAIGLSVKLSSLNYNFTVPVRPASSASTSASLSTSSEPSSSQVATSSSSSSSPSTNVIPANYTYNFPVPKKPEVTDVTSGFEDAILSDAELAGYGSGSGTPQTDLIISIPKIGIKSPVLQGLGGDSLTQGFWVYPTSKPIGEGEMILLCHRRYFGKYDPRSCWNLDQVTKGDEIFLRRGEQVLKYIVIGVNNFPGDSPNIYTISEDSNYLKLVTCSPLYSSVNRLVVLAELVE